MLISKSSHCMLFPFVCWGIGCSLLVLNSTLPVLSETSFKPRMRQQSKWNQFMVRLQATGQHPFLILTAALTERFINLFFVGLNISTLLLSSTLYYQQNKRILLNTLHLRWFLKVSYTNNIVQQALPWWKVRLLWERPLCILMLRTSKRKDCVFCDWLSTIDQSSCCVHFKVFRSKAYNIFCFCQHLCP